MELVEDKQQDRLQTIGVHTLEQIVGHSREKPSKDAACLLYTSPSPRDATLSRMPSSA